jgi:hypothetical protein
MSAAFDTSSFKTVRVVSINSEPRKHLIEAPAEWKGLAIKNSGRAFLCGRTIDKKTDHISVGGLGTGNWCNACWSRAGKTVIAP